MTARTQNARTTVNNTPPGALLPGQLFVEMATPLRLWAGVPTSIDATGRKLLVDAANASPWLPMTGGTLIGLLTLSGAPTANLHAATKAYADTKLPFTGGTLIGMLTLSGAPVNANDAATKGYVDGKAPVGGPYLPTTGGAITGNLTVGGTLGVTGAMQSNSTVQAGVAGPSGFATLRPGDTTHPGYVSFHNPTTGVMVGYIGFSNAATRLMLTAQAPFDGWNLGGVLDVSGALVARAGITLTGALDITATAGNNGQLFLHAAAGQFRNIIGAISGSGAYRWQVRLGDNTAEAAGDIGTDFAITRYDNAGTTAVNALTIKRSDGAVSIPGVLSVTTMQANTVALFQGAQWLMDANNTALVWDGGQWRLSYNRATGTLSYLQGGTSTDLFHIDGGGNVTSRGAMHPMTGDLGICPVAAGSYLAISGANTLAGGANLTINGGGRASYSFEFYWQANRIATLDFTGTLVVNQGYKPGGGVWLDASDARTKTVSGDYDPGLDAVLALQPVNYRFKGNDGGRHEDTDTEYAGLIAQDVRRVLPGMVRPTEGVIDGDEVDDLLVLDLSALPLVLVNAIKTLHARIEALETRH